MPSLVGGSGVEVGSGVDVAVGSRVDVAVGSAVGVEVGSGVDVAVGSAVGVDVGSGSAVGAGSTTGNRIHAPKISTLSTANSNWRQRWTECKGLLLDREQSNILTPVTFHISIVECHSTLHNNSKVGTNVVIILNLVECPFTSLCPPW